MVGLGHEAVPRVLGNVVAHPLEAGAQYLVDAGAVLRLTGSRFGSVVRDTVDEPGLALTKAGGPLRVATVEDRVGWGARARE